MEELRARQCAALLLRAEVLHLPELPPRVISCFQVLVLSSLFVIQAFQLARVLEPAWWITLAVVVDVLLVNVSCLTTTSPAARAKSYVWFVKPVQVEDTPQLDRVETSIDTLMERVDTVRTTTVQPEAETCARLDQIERKMDALIQRLDALEKTSKESDSAPPPHKTSGRPVAVKGWGLHSARDSKNS